MRRSGLIFITLALTISCLPITSMAEIAGNSSELIAESPQCGPINNSEMLLLKSTIPSNVSSCSFVFELVKCNKQPGYGLDLARRRKDRFLGTIANNI